MKEKSLVSEGVKIKLKAWYQASRPPFFIATLIPLGIGGRLAALEGHWDGLLWGAIVLASFFVHLNTNLSNDYFEYEYDSKEESIGGTRVLQQGRISLKEMRNAIIFLYFLAFILGLYILFSSRAWLLAAYILFAALSSLYYTAPPIKYAYRGLGELMVGVNMGPVMVSGTYLAMTGELSIKSLNLSLPVGIGVAFILFYQSLSDMEIDRKAGKYTLAVRLGHERISSAVLIFALCTYTVLILLYMTGMVNGYILISLPALIFIRRIRSMLEMKREWTFLHDEGKYARFFYLLIGISLLVSMI